MLICAEYDIILTFVTLSLQSDSGEAGIQTKKEENLYIVSAGLFLLLL